MKKIAQKNGSLNRNLLNLFIGRVYFRLYLVNPHVQAVQKMYAKGGYHLWHTFYIQIGCLRPSYRRPKLTLILKSAKCGVTKKQIKSKFSKVVTPYIFANVSQGTRMASSTLH